MSKVYEAAEITEGGSSYSYYDGETWEMLFLPGQYVDLSKKENRDAVCFVNALRPTWRERIRRRLRAVWRWLWA